MQVAARRLSVSAALILLGLCAAPQSARAGTISIDTKFQGVLLGYELQGTGPQNLDFFAAAVIGSVGMSSPVDVGLDPLSVFEAYCVDIIGPIFDPGTGTETVPVTVTANAAPMSTWDDPSGLELEGSDAGNKVAWLYNEFAVSAAASNADRSALAMAIWNVLYDTDLSVSNGDGTFFMYCDSTAVGFSGCNHGVPNTGIGSTGLVVAAANSYLAAVGAAFASGIPAGDATWLQLSLPVSDLQDFVGPPPGSSTPVPEPSSMVLLGMGMLGLAAHRQRQRQAARPGR